jgi:hypothetical protein
MRLDDRQLGMPFIEYKDTKANIEALAGCEQGSIAYATDTDELGTYDGADWNWGSGGVTDHGELDGLADDDHTHYVLRQPTADIVINESGGDFDFRIEGDIDEDLFFLDAGNDKVGVGKTSLAAKFHIGSSTDEVQFRVDADASQSENIAEFRNSSGDILAAIQHYGAFYSNKGATITNLFIGYEAGKNNTPNLGLEAGMYNTFVGCTAGKANTTASYNNAIGQDALSRVTTGDANNAIGCGALSYNTEGISNNAMGRLALLSNTTGDYNTAIGSESLYKNTTADGNVGIGYQAGRENQTGSANIFIGYNAGYNETGSNKLYIENSNSATPLIYGEFDNDIVKIYGSLVVNEAGGDFDTRIEGDTDPNLFFVDAGNDRIGLGTATPEAVLHVMGNVYADGGQTQMLNHVDNPYFTANLMRKDRDGAIVQDRDELGSFTFQGWDGTDYESAAAIIAVVDGTPSDGEDMPGMLRFYTRADVTVSYMSSRMIIRQDGKTGFGTFSPNEKLTVAGHITPSIDDTYDIGTASYRWDDIRATNGTIQTSDANIKDNVEDSDLGLDFITSLKPVKYKWKNYIQTIEEEQPKTDKDGNVIQHDGIPETEIVEKQIERTFTRPHYGLIAQDIEQLMIDKGIDDFAGFIKSEREDKSASYGLRYHEFIAPMIKAIQEQQTQIDDLVKRIEKLEAVKE